MDPDPRHDPRARPGLARTAIRRLLALPVNDQGITVSGTLALFIAMPVALVICLPILVVTTIVGVAAATLLSALGIPQSASGLLGFLGFIAGLALSFLVLVRLYRRLPTAIRAWIAREDEVEDHSAPVLDRYFDPDVATLDDRIAAADAMLAPPGSDDRADALHD